MNNTLKFVYTNTRDTKLLMGIRTYTAHNLFHHRGGFLRPFALPALTTARPNSALRHGKNVPTADVRIATSWLTAKRVCLPPTTPHTSSRVRTSYAHHLPFWTSLARTREPGFSCSRARAEGVQTNHSLSRSAN